MMASQEFVDLTTKENLCENLDGAAWGLMEGEAMDSRVRRVKATVDVGSPS